MTTEAVAGVIIMVDATRETTTEAVTATVTEAMTATVTVTVNGIMTAIEAMEAEAEAEEDTAVDPLEESAALEVASMAGAE